MTPQPAKPRVLIVDDHHANLRAFETLLENDYTTHVAVSGFQALELTLREEFAVILLDVKMPGMDGFEVAELLRKRERTRFTPIIFMSAYDQTIVQAKKGYVAGATDFLFSPVDEGLLRLKVATYAQIFLRNEAFRIQIRGLQDTIRSLEIELARYYPMEPIQQRIQSLENQVIQLRQQLEITSQ